MRDLQEKHFRREGASVVELLVSMAVIGVLFAILLPAIQTAREAARRTQCRSNLHQIGSGMHQFVAGKGVFPTKAASAYQDVAAHLERTGLDFRAIASFSCPSDPLVRTDLGEYSYHMNSGTRFRFAPDNQSWVDYNGLLSFSRNRPASEITDGLSNTAAYAERLSVGITDAQVVRLSDKRYMWYIPASVAGYGRESELIDMCRMHRTTQTPRIVHTYSNLWLSLPGYNHFLKPNESGCVNGAVGNVASETPLSPPSSFHPGGVSVLFCDGHVSFVSDDIHEEVWHSLGTISGGDLAGQ